MEYEPIEIFGIMDKVMLLPDASWSVISGKEDFKMPEYWTVVGIRGKSLILSCDDAIIEAGIGDVFKIKSLKPPFTKGENDG